jgi:hypothetical protein
MVLLGRVDGFSLGKSDIVVDSTDNTLPLGESKQLLAAAQAWIDSRRAGRDGILIMVGSTDRTRLAEKSRQRFDSNVGLAQSRAEAVKEALIARCKLLSDTCDLRDSLILTLVSGPGTTTELGRDMKISVDGYPQDRHVDIWAIWSAQVPR